jgi:sulfur-oxidizing protein SoxZ
MTEPSRIRAQTSGGKTTVRVLMSHDMESGQRKDAAGKLIPAWFIQEVQITLNGKTVLTAEWGAAISKNPFLQLVLRDARAGDRVGVIWRDSRGAVRSDEALVG